MTVTVDKSTKVTIGLVLAAIVLLSPPVVWLTNMHSSVKEVRHDVEGMASKTDLAVVVAKIDGLMKDLDAAKDERYRMTNASEDALRMAIENPGLRVPDPRNPGKVFVVQVGAVKPSGTSSIKLPVQTEGSS